ncbi:hypothetical protein DVA86_10795 [Streptomyces armeniacus]|uniref:MaoC-like domain-containing protein n=1 Tax=Streptomyces armeniacus TaxID=83291 RepID=A0A345XN48_9ACTN|nr:MaoC/PaaZ C-terminal domain-containing protein [Streptomyces armeniacus]AXK33064.1 hypothetical protein DVA86_10795 [Streptomyces armeniacus]
MLATTLAKGALGSLRKRGPYDGARLPAGQLVLSGARVDHGKLAAYADVCGFTPPVTPPARALLPATYPHVLGFPLAMRLMADPAFPFPLLGLVHTGIEITQHRALRAADRPELRVRAEGLAPHRRGSRFDVLTEAWLDGTEVWRSRSTYLYRHRRAPDEGARNGRTDAEHGDEGHRDAEHRTEAARAEPLPVRAEWALPGSLGRRYAAASGDRNPIHLHPLTARPFGFRRAIAHGMWLVARCLAEAQNTGGTGTGGTGTGSAGSAEQLALSAEFRAPVLLPATVAYGERNGSFELRGAPTGAGTAGGEPPLHLSGRVSSGRPSSGSPGPPSRSS